MSLRFFVGSVALAVACAAPVWAQLYDNVRVTFANSVQVNGTVIPAGEYEIRQVHSDGAAARILFVTQRGAIQFEASGATVPIMDNQPASKTRVILEHIGQNYYLNKIWVAGKDYGYEFPLPAEARALMQERAEPLTLSATYTPAPKPVVAETQPAPQPAPAPPPPPAAEPQPAAPPQPAPEAQSAPSSQPAPPVPAPENLPATADNWAAWAAAGGLLTAFGVLLRERPGARQ